MRIIKSRSIVGDFTTDFITIFKLDSQSVRLQTSAEINVRNDGKTRDYQ